MTPDPTKARDMRLCADYMGQMASHQRANGDEQVAAYWEQRAKDIRAALKPQQVEGE